MADEMMKYNSILDDIKKIIESGRNAAYGAVNSALLMTYWNLGKRIVEDEQAGDTRAAYGSQLLKVLSEELTKEYGRGFS